MSLAFSSLGSGQLVVFVHGCPTFPDVLGPVATAVSRTHRAVRIALPGYGASPALAGAWTLADLQARIEETVAGLTPEGPRAPVALVGFSGGGYHALALAVRGNLAVTQVVCLAGLMAQTQAGRDGFRQFAAALRQGVDLHGIAPDRFLSPAFRATHPDAVRAVTAWLDATPPANLANELEAFAAAPDLDAGVAALTVPILARVGALDVAAGPAASEAIVAAARAGTLEVVTGSGHALMYEDLEGTTASVVKALAR